MDYTVRPAQQEDLPRVLELYRQARAFMAAHGNPSQWGSTDPEEKTVRRDMEQQNLYVLQRDGILHGVFAFLIFEDPTYRIIEEGAWHWDRPYGVIHRVAGDGSGGILKAAVAYAQQYTDYLRIDTHRDNLPMQRAIRSQGFLPCGIIYTEKGDRRIAFDRRKTL